MQVYVSVAKRKVMEALNLPAEYKALLTTDDRAALLHAVPLWRVSLKHMARLLKHYRGRYNTIVGFQPTGWSMQTGMALALWRLHGSGGPAHCLSVCAYLHKPLYICKPPQPVSSSIGSHIKISTRSCRQVLGMKGSAGQAGTPIC